MRITALTLAELEGAPGISMALLNDGHEPACTRIDIAHLERGSSLPKHRAGSAQQFYVISGTGRAAGSDDIEHPIRPGTLVQWQQGEEHTSWADTDMTVIIIQHRTARPHHR